MRGPTTSSNVLIRQLWADEKFFKRHPDRHHRVRRVSPLERYAFTDWNDTVWNTPPGLALFIAVARPRLIALFAAASNLDTKSLSEAACADIFEWAMSPGLRQIRALMKSSTQPDD